MRSVRAEEVARRERNRLATAERDAERRRAAVLLFAAAGATAAGTSAAAAADAPPKAPRVRALEARAATRAADIAVDLETAALFNEAGSLTTAAARHQEAGARAAATREPPSFAPAGILNEVARSLCVSRAHSRTVTPRHVETVVLRAAAARAALKLVSYGVPSAALLAAGAGTKGAGSGAGAGSCGGAGSHGGAAGGASYFSMPGDFMLVILSCLSVLNGERCARTSRTRSRSSGPTSDSR
jgi:hypothetical protein